MVQSQILQIELTLKHPGLCRPLECIKMMELLTCTHPCPIISDLDSRLPRSNTAWSFEPSVSNRQAHSSQITSLAQELQLPAGACTALGFIGGCATDPSCWNSEVLTSELQNQLCEDLFYNHTHWSWMLEHTLCLKHMRYSEVNTLTSMNAVNAVPTQ